MNMTTHNRPVSLILYQPEIPGNTGTLMRLAACWGGQLELIGPLGFVPSDRHLKRAGMDYSEWAAIQLHASWSDYSAGHCTQSDHRKIAVIPYAGLAYTDFAFAPGDHLIMGSESCGLPDSVGSECDVEIHIPMILGVRSLNLAIASAIVWAEALRQTQGLPHS
jgi:tRNA (cytidine/uridine-2'-O-)-methyltransferase